jgi:NADPH:quinone reductase-like Zn-dependent oxidoreductase
MEYRKMRALFVNEIDGPFVLREIARPEPARGQVLVRIAASGVNPLDTKIRAGRAPHARQPLAAVLGVDLAGVVEAVGDGVDALRPDDEVYGLATGVGGHQGSLAEYAAVDAALVARKPARLSMREAAALPLVLITAWEGLVDRAGVATGMKVLIQGGAGGVGHIAVQLARAFGAEVCASDSAGRRAIIEELGATFIDRESPMPEVLAAHPRRLRHRLQHRRGRQPGRGLPVRAHLHRPRGQQSRLGTARARAAVVPRRHLFGSVHAPAAPHRHRP